MLKYLRENGGDDADLIFLPGDLVAHKLPLDEGEVNPEKYKKLEETIAKVTDLMNEHFGDKIFTPAMGNNDPKYHYQPASLADEPEQHAFVFNEWFNRLGRNREVFNLEKIKPTFMQGAYYRADVTNQISVLSLNTLYWNTQDVTTDQGNAPTDQMNWLR